jgi:2-polyprenyl-6-methoxyphenol hydroxylase-like FAD-dependent oxidoreductase
MGARVDGLLEDAGGVCGVRYTAADGRHAIQTPLVVGADGRFSKVRQLARMEFDSTTEPEDVLWFRVPRAASDPPRAHGIYLAPDGVLVVMPRPDDWHIGYILAKGAYPRLRAAGMAAFRESISRRAPWLSGRTTHLVSWSQTSLLVIEAGRVRRWYKPGLLLIGDAAHVMSPVFGVGINYAIQDAIVASNVLGHRLRNHTVRQSDLAVVQRRREWPTRLMQTLQREMRPPVPAAGPPPRPSLSARLLRRLPIGALRGRLIASGGWQPERVLNPLENLQSGSDRRGGRFPATSGDPLPSVRRTGPTEVR